MHQQQKHSLTLKSIIFVALEYFFINFAIFAFYILSIYILISLILQNQNECRSKPVSFSITPDTLHNVQEVMIPPVRASFLQEDIIIISIFQLSLAVFLFCIFIKMYIFDAKIAPFCNLG